MPDAGQDTGSTHIRSSDPQPPPASDQPPLARLTLDAATDSVPAARRFVRETLAVLDAAAASDDAIALVSELATNAVIHARTPYTIIVTRAGDTVRVGVQDGSAVVPRRRTYGLDATTGRGLRLVDTMASSWGIDAQAGGKVVWFELPRDGGQGEASAWYADVDVESLLDTFGDPDLVGSSRSAPGMTE